MRRNATKVEHSVNRFRRFSGILCRFYRLHRFPSFFLVAFFLNVIAGRFEESPLISRFPNPLYETRVVYRAALRHLSTPNLLWSVMKHAVAQWLDPSKLHAEQPLSRPIRRGCIACILVASMTSKDDATRTAWKSARASFFAFACWFCGNQGWSKKSTRWRKSHT